jgi:hypothetical protein
MQTSSTPADPIPAETWQQVKDSIRAYLWCLEHQHLTHKERMAQCPYPH